MSFEVHVLAKYELKDQSVALLFTLYGKGTCWDLILFSFLCIIPKPGKRIHQEEILKPLPTHGWWRGLPGAIFRRQAFGSVLHIPISIPHIQDATSLTATFQSIKRFKLLAKNSHILGFVTSFAKFDLFCIFFSFIQRIPSLLAL